MNNSRAAVLAVIILQAALGCGEQEHELAEPQSGIFQDEFDLPVDLKCRTDTVLFQGSTTRFYGHVLHDGRLVLDQCGFQWTDDRDILDQFEAVGQVKEYDVYNTIYFDAQIGQLVVDQVYYYRSFFRGKYKGNPIIGVGPTKQFTVN